MKYGLKVSLSLLAAALFISVLIWLARRQPTPAPPPPSGGQSVPIIPEPRQVSGWRLENDNGKFRFVRGRQENEWLMVEPTSVTVDQIGVGIMANQFLELKKERMVARSEQELERFGLNPPAGRFTYFFWRDQPELTLELGNLTPTQKNLYARVVGEPEIFLVDRIVYQYLSWDLNKFRQARLTLTPGAALVSLEIQYLDPAAKNWFPRGDSTQFVYQTTPTGKKWLMLKPYPETVNSNTIYSFTQNLLTIAAKSMEIPDEGISRFGLDRPALAVILERNDHSLERMIFSRPDPHRPVFYAQNSLFDLVFEVPLEKMTAAFNQDFRRVYLLDAEEQGAVTKITVAFPSQPERNYTLTLAAFDTWVLEDEPQRQLNPAASAWVLSPLTEIPSGSYYVYDRGEGAASFGLDSPRAVIKLNSGEVQTVEFIIGAATAKPKGCYVLDRRREALIWAAKDLYAEIPPERKVFYLPETGKAAP